jgi:proteasome component ECM29
LPPLPPPPQASLVKLLRDKSELAQEGSAKALSLLYHSQPPGPADELAQALLASLRGAHATANLDVNGPARVAAPIMDLGANPYRELCTLASDLGRPELLYWFLALPASHAAWSTRRGVK